MNDSNPERVLSGIIGIGLAAAGLARRGWVRWAFLAVGGSLVLRALTGLRPIYQPLDSDKRRDRSGVPGNRGTRIEASVEINCDAETLFGFWRNLEQLPRVMRHVESVEEGAGKLSHWKVAGPAGQTLEWDAEIINERQGRLIAWQSLPGASVSNAGSVRFEPTRHGATRVKVALEFDPPAGSVGTAVAGLLGNSPQSDLMGDLQRFKMFAEAELRDSRGRAQLL